MHKNRCQMYRVAHGMLSHHELRSSLGPLLASSSHKHNALSSDGAVLWNSRLSLSVSGECGCFACVEQMNCPAAMERIREDKPITIRDDKGNTSRCIAEIVSVSCHCFVVGSPLLGGIFVAVSATTHCD